MVCREQSNARCECYEKDTHANNSGRKRGLLQVRELAAMVTGGETAHLRACCTAAVTDREQILERRQASRWLLPGEVSRIVKLRQGQLGVAATDVISKGIPAVGTSRQSGSRSFRFGKGGDTGRQCHALRVEVMF
jgi:hypothetical protein